MCGMQETTGLELKLERIAQRIDQATLARAAGRRREWVSRTEARVRVTEKQAQRFREALATCRTDSTSEEAA